MKLLKKIWFPLVLLILILILLLGTCKKTNALYDSGLQQRTIYISMTDTDTGYIQILQPKFNNSTIISTLYTQRPTYYDRLYTNLIFDSVNNEVYITITSLANPQDPEDTVLYTGSRIGADRLIAVIAMIGPNNYDTTSELSWCFCFVQCINGAITYTYNWYYGENMETTMGFINDAFNNNEVRIDLFPDSHVYSYYKGTSNVYMYDALDYSSTFSEQIPDLLDDFINPSINLSTSIYLYNNGYNAGYQQGYDDGYEAGQTAGYNSGYTAGYNVGVNDNETAFNRGYDEGQADGYADGLLAGYDNGYADGYDIGFNEGMDGATPVSQTVGVISSIFAGIGTVLAVQLFPGFPIGLLILVPLFFAVLGLILWIWRRN